MVRRCEYLTSGSEAQVTSTSRETMFIPTVNVVLEQHIAGLEVRVHRDEEASKGETWKRERTKDLAQTRDGIEMICK